MSTSEWLPSINRELCTGCRKCVEVCPTEVLAQVKGKASLAYPDRCTYCSACEEICPVQAINLPFLIVKPDSTGQDVPGRKQESHAAKGSIQ